MLPRDDSNRRAESSRAGGNGGSGRVGVARCCIPAAVHTRCESFTYAHSTIDTLHPAPASPPAPANTRRGSCCLSAALTDKHADSEGRVAWHSTRDLTVAVDRPVPGAGSLTVLRPAALIMNHASRLLRAAERHGPHPPLTLPGARPNSPSLGLPRGRRRCLLPRKPSHMRTPNSLELSQRAPLVSSAFSSADPPPSECP